MSAVVVKFPGFKVTLGDREFVLPPLNAAAAKVHWPRMLALQKGTETDVLDVGAGVVHACLLRNYPQLTRDEVDDLVDLGNVEELMAKAGGDGSFKRWTQQQLAQQGNVMPQPTATDGTGAPSTQESPLPPATDSPTSTS